MSNESTVSLAAAYRDVHKPDWRKEGSFVIPGLGQDLKALVDGKAIPLTPNSAVAPNLVAAIEKLGKEIVTFANERKIDLKQASEFKNFDILDDKGKVDATKVGKVVFAAASIENGALAIDGVVKMSDLSGLSNNPLTQISVKALLSNMDKGKLSSIPDLSTDITPTQDGGARTRCDSTLSSAVSRSSSSGCSR
jgi:hypothetical protein